MKRILTMVVMLALVGCGQKDKNHQLVRWSDWTNDCYDIEVERISAMTGNKTESIVVIPNVLFIQKAEQFVIGRADWKYLEGFPKSQTDVPMTNEFWFVLDKDLDYPKCLSVTTNEQRWAAWCSAHSIKTNLVSVNAFVQAAQALPSYAGGDPRL